MKQQKYSFKKKRSNTDSLKNLLIIISLMISTTFAVRFYFEIELIRKLDTIPQLLFESLVFSIVTTISIFFIVIVFKFFFKPWWYLLFRLRLNALFENLGKNETLSKKLAFPEVEMVYDKINDAFTFTFFWKGKMTKNIQNEIQGHLLSELLFPSNDYLLEEPIQTQAFTKFIYKKKPKRLVVTYGK